MKRQSYLGIDLGTSGIRCLLLQASGKVLASAEASYGTMRPQNGWSEQNPEDWITALKKCCAQLRDRHYDQYAAIAGIGVSGQMHGATLLGKNGKVLRPAILWNDSRSHREAQELDRTEMRDISSNIVFAGFTAPKLLWVARNEPEIFREVEKVLLPAAYLNYWLTGRAASDYSDSSGTSWLDIGKRQWSHRALALTDLSTDQMPELVVGHEVIGSLNTRAAQALDLPQKVQVVGGAGDNAAAACGAGIVHDGDGFVSLGTSGVLLLARKTFEPNANAALHSFCHATKETFIQMGVTLSATDSLNWLSSITKQTPAQLTQALGDTLSTPSSVQFYPYLSGERTPLNDAQIRGAFVGIEHQSDNRALTKSVLEGVAFALRSSLEALKTTGAAPRSLLALGGGAQSFIWLKTLATILDIPLKRPAEGELGAALGAARLAQIGVENQSPNTILLPPQTEATIEPESKFSQAFEEKYFQFAKAAPLLRKLQSI